MCAVLLCCYILRAISGHHTYCDTDRIISQAASLSTRPQRRPLPSWRRACMAKDVSIFVTRVSLSLVCFSVCSQPPERSKSHGIRFPSIGDIITLSFTTEAAQRNKTFFLLLRMYVKCVRLLQLPQLFVVVFFLEIFSRLAFHFFFFHFFLLQDGVRP